METTRLQSLTAELWCAESEVRVGVGVVFPLRMTVIRLADGGLWIHSPLAIYDALAAELQALGPVAHLVAPNLYHHLYVRDAARRFPQAQVWAPEGIERKQPDLQVHHRLSPDAPWAREVEALPVEGAAGISEWVFLHRASRSLIVTDLVFNIDDAPRGVTRWLLRLTGALGQLARSRVWNLMIKDRSAFAASVRRVLALEFERVIPSHGDVVSENAQIRMREVLAKDAAG